MYMYICKYMYIYTHIYIHVFKYVYIYVDLEELKLELPALSGADALPSHLAPLGLAELTKSDQNPTICRFIFLKYDRLMDK